MEVDITNLEMTRKIGGKLEMLLLVKASIE
jgi:hypothetical protein